MKKIIAPSILSADFSRLGEEIKAVEQGGADWVHIDVMDGHFVPNITIGPLIVKAAKKVTTMPLDVHLMIENPDQFLDEFIDAGADYLTVHVEACRHLQRTLSYIRGKGIKSGVSLNPATPLSTLEHVLPDLDLVLLMSVNPGFGGQSFIPQDFARLASDHFSPPIKSGSFFISHQPRDGLFSDTLICKASFHKCHIPSLPRPPPEPGRKEKIKGGRHIPGTKVSVRRAETLEIARQKPGDVFSDKIPVL